MGNAINMIGQQFGRLTVIDSAQSDSRGERYWTCKCKCGNIKRVSGYKLRTGNTKSCGCLQSEIRNSGVLRRTHGKTLTKLYAIWNNMKARCLNPKSSSYNSYGGRGIEICKEWLSFDAFNAWATKSGYSEGLSIDRIDVNGNYEPNNCRWVTKEAQHLNKRASHLITAYGKTQTLKEWADEKGLKYDTLERRLNSYGWSIEEALSTPTGSIKRRH